MSQNFYFYNTCVTFKKKYYVNKVYFCTNYEKVQIILFNGINIL